MNIQDILKQIGQREVPMISEESDISTVIEVIVRFPHARLIYVINAQKKLRGTITVGSLLRHLFPYHYKCKVHARGILRNITAEKAVDIMDRENIFATAEETVDTVLKRMAATGAKEMAVIDQDDTILGDITAVDLLRHYHLQ